MSNANHAKKRSAPSSRRQWGQLSQQIQGALGPFSKLPIGPSTLDLKHAGKRVQVSFSECQLRIFDRIYRSLLTKYIELQNMSRQSRATIVFGIFLFCTIVTIDRCTTTTMSHSKWARMMYEDGKTPNTRGAAALPVVERPRDLHIAFVGDSVTRYMYLDLVYFLKHNRWVQDDEYPNILNAKHFPSWNDHYNFSNAALAPNEQCDCFRNNPKNSSHIDKEETIENRYYSDPELNNYATFIEIFGGTAPHGHWLARDAHKPHVLDFEKLQNDPFVWRQDWPGLIRNYLNKLTPKPDFLVFNEGLWIEHELGNVDVQQSIKDALEDTGIIGIYKTTTLPNINSGLAKRSAGVVFNRHDAAMCEMIENYLDFSWTKDLGDEHYWDGVHFKPHVNRGMNMELLDYLQVLKRRKETPAPAVVAPEFEEGTTSDSPDMEERTPLREEA